MPASRPRLARILTLRIVGVFLSAFLLAGFLFNYVAGLQSEQRFRAGWEERVETIARVLGPVLTEGDFAVAAWVGEQLYRDDNLVEVAITDVIGRILFAERSQPGGADTIQIRTQVLSPVDQISPLGSIFVVVKDSRQSVLEYDFQRVFFFAVILIWALMAVAMYLIVKTYVTKPLARLNERAELFSRDVAAFRRRDDRNETKEIEAIELTLERAAVSIAERGAARDEALRERHAELNRRRRVSDISGAALARAGVAVFSASGTDDEDGFRLGAEAPPRLQELFTKLEPSATRAETLLKETKLKYQLTEHGLLASDEDAAKQLYQFEVWGEKERRWLVRGVELEAHGFVLICADITEDRAMQAQLSRAQKSDAIAQLTSGVAHDFNNLLGVIQANAELLLLREPAPEIAAVCNQIDDAVRRGAHLTGSLLSFARESRLEETVCQLDVIVKDVVKWAVRVLPKAIDTEVVTEGGLWPVRIDADMMGNALLNLLLNARDAMPNGGKLTIEASNCRIGEDYIWGKQEDVPPGRYVRLSVTDTGEGIPEEIRDKIFDPFFTTKKAGEGSGVGLAMVFGFVKQSSGMVQLYSEPGEGTTFKLYFPASDEAPQQSKFRDAGDVKSTEGARVLLIEDEAELRRLMKDLMTKAGYELTVAAHGTEALALISRGFDCDVIVSDVVMAGGMLGPEFVQAAKAQGFSRPVVYLTGYARDASIRGQGLRPSDRCLQKPVSRTELIRAVEAALKEGNLD